ncbi:NAD(P)H-dependent flavin oxidoreductase [Chloroflexota bacterium]
MKTRMTELFGIKHPIMSAGMSWVATPKMVAAVCNAGALGLLAASPLTPEEARRVIRETRELTDKPFGINQTLVSPTAKANISVAIEEKVPIINYALGRPWFIEQVHEYGGKVIGTVALSRHAIRAEQFGVDALNITGHEAGGHPARATSMVLIPIIASRVKVPLIAAGGFYDGRGLVAALALGADAINMGTRFAMTKESNLNEYWRPLILKATEQDTVYIDHGALSHRVLKTKESEAEMKGGFPVIGAITSILEVKRLLKLSWGELIRSSLSTRKVEGGLGMLDQIRYAAGHVKLKRVISDGDSTAGSVAAGQAIGGINDVPSCQEVVERTVAEAEEILESMSRKFST